MRLFAHQFVTLAAAALNVALLVACSGQPSQQPTQTPIYLVIPGETPPITPGDPAGTALPAGFPTPFICNAEIVEQPYEHGRMFWVGKTLDERCKEEHDFTPGSGEIWVLIFDQGADDGEWFAFVDDWDSESEIPFDITMTEPPGLYQPVRGFGKVWRERLTDEQRIALGWALALEIKFVTTYRYDGGGFINGQGTFIPRPGLHTLTSFGGERFFLDEQTRRFQYIPAG